VSDGTYEYGYFYLKSSSRLNCRMDVFVCQGVIDCNRKNSGNEGTSRSESCTFMNKEYSNSRLGPGSPQTKFSQIAGKAVE